MRFLLQTVALGALSISDSQWSTNCKDIDEKRKNEGKMPHSFHHYSNCRCPLCPKALISFQFNIDLGSVGYLPGAGDDLLRKIHITTRRRRHKKFLFACSVHTFAYMFSYTRHKLDNGIVLPQQSFLAPSRSRRVSTAWHCKEKL